MIDTKEIVDIPNILDVPFLPSAKPSDVLKSMPRDKWNRGSFNNVETGQMCAVGYLADRGGMVWDEYWDSLRSLRPFDSSARNPAHNPAAFVYDQWGLDWREINRLMLLNDSTGLDAAIGYLESIGK